MQVAHDTRATLRSAIALVNTAEAPDTLVTAVQLTDFVATYGFTGRHDGDENELAAVRQLRPTLRQLFTLPCEDTVRLVNQLLEDGPARPRLVGNADAGWQLHAVDPGEPLATRITVESAMAMADLIQIRETDRLSVCADEICNGLVFDLSRNRTRRYCSTACCNRAAAAAYRTRVRQISAPRHRTP